jgi:hypothetical protein
MTLTGVYPSAVLASIVKSRSLLAVMLGSLALAAPRPAAAQDVAGPGVPGCIALLVRDAVPANLEWSYWLAGGGGSGKGGGQGLVGVGTEATTGLATFGDPHHYGGPFELRWGPWWGLVSDLRGVRGEGGLTWLFGQTQHAQWGTYGLRLGGGFGDDGLGSAPHFVATLTGGIRQVEGRYADRGACDPPMQPKAVAFATGIRLFASARTVFSAERPWQLTFGIELEPSFFFPPYSLQKWIGAGPGRR